MSSSVPNAASSVPAVVSPERLMQMAWGFAPPLMIEAGLKAGLFEALEAGPRTVAELAAATSASERGLELLLNGLVGIGLARREGGGFSLTEESAAFLVSGKPSYFGGFFRHISDQLIPKWLGLTDSVATGRPVVPVNQEADGSEFFAEFVEALIPLSWQAANALADSLQVADAAASGPYSVLDVAAGSGVWSIALARRSPQVRVTAVDWPGVIPTTRRVASRFGVESQYVFEAGDLRDADFGNGHHVAVLGHILHSEGAARGRELLAKVHAALAPGGTVAIAEFLKNDDLNGPPAACIFGVNMLVGTEAGDTYSFAEIARWLEAAGFSNARLLQVQAPSPLILAEK